MSEPTTEELCAQIEALTNQNAQLADEVTRLKLEDRWMTSREAGEYLGISAQTLHDHRKAGDGPQYSHRTHKMLRYRKSALDLWMEDTLVGV